ncbi:MAG: hypothetical protein A2287_08605 [Candidatus Melainabacteria bacterium RIFOXYA12_FULL_32_12]|nr:MAG: hypothetical protein A2255_01310 [Candidatus Melainabacteria bacterium RIFOXYA2_FULL_32_9]OGI30441.1 MAG: hypothetical protein A2287_08605 [Candidatus Melainabacteria bacterium RIFOXYA12_FULL_32_12]
MIRVYRQKICKGRYFGFTLAEILIAITVIGIIAAMTIPAIVNSTSETQLNAAAKAVTNKFVQAERLIRYENGGTMGDVCADHNSTCISGKFTEKCT